jgi:hypothetical protein
LPDMRKELEQGVIARWPAWFDVHRDVRRTLMPFGFQCEDGWFNLIRSLCEELEPLVAEVERTTKKQFKVIEVKQKFGSLRFYVDNANDAIRECIEVAQQQSSGICELCGRAGRLRQGDWLRVQCDEHAEERQM